MPTDRKVSAPRSAPVDKSDALDAVDGTILRELSLDARLSASELARRVGMSAPAVRERVARLEGRGAIRGYHADIDPAALGLPVSAWVRVQPGPQQLAKLADLVERTPQVSECHRITGEDCFLLKVHVRSVDELAPLLDRFLPHGRTSSSIVVTTSVAPRAPATP